MKVYFGTKPEPSEGRTHPYESSDWSTYYDFKKQPDMIPEILEDFTPWAHYSAIQRFYKLLAWLNGPESRLESNDCAFRGPEPNASKNFTKRLECGGRLMIFYRNLRLNTQQEFGEALKQAFKHYLALLEPNLEWGAVEICTMPVRYLAISGDETQQMGKEVNLTFWAWGDDEEETMGNLDRVFWALSECCRFVSEDIRVAGR